MFNNKRPQVSPKPGVWIYDFAALIVEDVGSEVVANPLVGTVIDYETKTVQYTVFGDNFWHVMGQLQGWYFNWVGDNDE